MSESRVAGVVSATGARAVRAGERWALRFTFDTWRVEGGRLSTAPLALSGEVATAELGATMQRLRAFSVVGARVRLDTGELIALAPEAVADAELASRVAELSRPATRRDPRFGTLTFNPRVGWFDGTSRWGDREVAVAFQAEDAAGLDAALRTGGELWDAQPAWNERIQAFAVAKLLALKNRTWLGEDEQPVTAAEFRRRMQLRSITLGPEGRFDFWHDDGDLFWGHSIQVRGDVSRGPTHADIPG